METTTAVPTFIQCTDDEDMYEPGNEAANKLAEILDEQHIPADLLAWFNQQGWKVLIRKRVLTEPTEYGL